MKPYLLLLLTNVLLGLMSANAQNGTAKNDPNPPVTDLKMSYYNRHKIDISNLRDFYDGLLIADVMIHGNAMFDAKTKWKLTLYQMILAGSNHHQARSAYQLSLMGVPTEEILAIWSPNYVATLNNPRIQSAFRYIQLVSNLPTRVTADTHADLRMHFIDRQIAELTDMAAINNANAVHDQILPIATDEETLNWATKNLSSVGWSPGLNASQKEEQQAKPFVGKDLEKAYNEIISDWKPESLANANPKFQSDWINYLTGYKVSPVTFDADLDGIEDPFDAFPVEPNQWKKPGLEKENLPPTSTPVFNVGAYDYKYFQPSSIPRAKYPFSDRLKFDTEWTRQSSFGTLKMDSYLLIKDRAIPVYMKWSMFFVYQLASGCVHCQVHGSFGMFQEIEKEYINNKIPKEDMPKALKRIHALFDFERADQLSNAEKAALRLARDAGRLPGTVNATHIEELRRYYSDREIQEMIATLVLTAWLSTSMQSQATVTDRLSMSWALQHLTPKGWNPGVHTGLPHEQRPFHMSQLFATVLGKMAMGEVADAATEWVGYDIPLAIDSDLDGVDDTFDGFPSDASRWEDTDRDGIENSKDNDIDGDGIPNQEEILLGTFPYKADSDGDGVDDLKEIQAGTDPVNPRDF